MVNYIVNYETSMMRGSWRKDVDIQPTLNRNPQKPAVQNRQCMLSSSIYITSFINAVQMCVSKINNLSGDSVMVDKENIVTPQSLQQPIRPLMK